ncbi:hypothetical protein Taro_048198 [Colocasia esculenta]|uniref:Uncharacterized protein n=1 Tax=Colocasia esculenta TaxID=4460 RepID=A0A843X2E5_COLES|nr:hypothetical protein [Colocasia esculenta]
MLISSTEKNIASSPSSVKAGGWMARGRFGGNMDRIKTWTKDAAGGDGIVGLLGGLHGPSARPRVEGTAGVRSTVGWWPLAVALGAPLAAREEEGHNGGMALDQVTASAKLGGTGASRAVGEEEGPSSEGALSKDAASASFTCSGVPCGGIGLAVVSMVVLRRRSCGVTFHSLCLTPFSGCSYAVKRMDSSGCVCHLLRFRFLNWHFSEHWVYIILCCCLGCYLVILSTRIYSGIIY